ncbi:MAG: YaeQ family protein [Acidobacteria bacterium]|nr:YaeQ family protein [Acidobacteriota bacterium]
MALGATIYNFDIDLADSDRQVYESLALRLAQHPSESEEYLVARLLAYLLEYAEGIEFSRGVSTPDDPTIAVRDLTGAVRTWIDIGTPDAARLHRASKAADRVVVYTHKDPAQFLRQLEGAAIHRADALELYALDRALIGALVARLERRVAFSVSITERELYVSIGADNLTGAVVRLNRTGSP